MTLSHQTPKGTYRSEETFRYGSRWTFVYVKRYWWIFPYWEKIGEFRTQSLWSAKDVIYEYEENQEREALKKNEMYE